MLKFVGTYFLLLFCSVVLGQNKTIPSIRGKVVSINSQMPIPNAMIEYSKGRGTLTDSVGNFSIYNLQMGAYRLLISAPGYDSKDTTVNLHDGKLDSLRISVFTNCSGFTNFNSDKAHNDINLKTPRLLLIGGIAPMVYTTDRKFERRYGVEFYDFGCEPDKIECILSYNNVVFDYLDKKFGKKWRSEVRKDVVGLK